MGKHLYILDVSGYVYRAYFALPPMTNHKGEATHALYGFVRSLLKLDKDFSPEYLVAVFDGPESLRERLALYPEYKSHRRKSPDDLFSQMSLAATFCDLAGIPRLALEGVEADDAMAAVALWAHREGMQVSLCSSDKDLCQLVREGITLLNTHKNNLVLDAAGVETLYGVKPTQIVDYLALVGDSSDNIPGVAGLGPKSAAQLLQTYGTLENLLENAHAVPGRKGTLLAEGKARALLSQQLARLRTDLSVPKELTFFQRTPPHREELQAFYREMDFSSLLEKSPAPQSTTQCTLIDSPGELAALLAHLSTAPEIALAIATHDAPATETKILGFGFCTRAGHATYLPATEASLEALRPLLGDPKCKFLGHNIKFLYHALKNAQLPLPAFSFDTMLASYLLAPNSYKHSLPDLLLRFLGRSPEEPSAKESAACCQAVDALFQLKQHLAPELARHHLTPLFHDMELPLSRLLMEMEQTGIYLDLPQLQALSSTLTAQLERLREEITLLAGESFNINSPKQLSHILFEKLQLKVPGKKKNLSTRAEILELLVEQHPIAPKLLEFRTLEKLRSTYTDALPLCVSSRTQRIHPTFVQWGAATGRLSCQDPNLQNIPIRTAQGRAIRAAFKPQHPGWSFLGADYSQIELRLLAHLSEDPVLLAAFQRGDDIHAKTASLIFETPLEEVTPLQRHRAKAVNFGIVYGQQAYGLAAELDISPQEADRFIQAYFKRYPKVLDFMELCKNRARTEGKAVTMRGREREIADMHSSNGALRAAAERLAINTPLQGSAADLIKAAMLVVEAKMREAHLESRMVLQIHDELIFEAKETELETLTPLVKENMESIFPLKVPLVVDIRVGKNWGEC